MICVVDFGLGNVQAFINIYRHLDFDVCAATTAEQLRAAERIILPGVGAFDWAMDRLNQSGMRDILDSLVLDTGVPVLGICVGMQMMMEKSEEGEASGLGWVEGDVRRFVTPRSGPRVPLPHMGWNDVRPIGKHGLFQSCGEDMRFYFLHSYFVQPADDDHVRAVTDYSGPFAAALGKENILGVQFHPEKSHKWGVELLRTFGCGDHASA